MDFTALKQFSDHKDTIRPTKTIKATGGLKSR